MTPEQLDEIEKLAEAATSGLWVAEKNAALITAMREYALPMVKALREARAEMDEFAIAVGYGERPEGQSGVHRIHGEQLAALWKQCDRERDAARAEVERLREAVRKVHALVSGEMEWTIDRVDYPIQESHKITKGMVE